MSIANTKGILKRKRHRIRRILHLFRCFQPSHPNVSKQRVSTRNNVFFLNFGGANFSSIQRNEELVSIFSKRDISHKGIRRAIAKPEFATEPPCSVGMLHFPCGKSITEFNVHVCAGCMPVATNRIAGSCVQIPLNPSFRMGGNYKIHKTSLLLLLPEDVFRTILRFLGTPKALSPLLTSCKSTYRILENSEVQDVNQEAVCPDIEFGAAWNHPSPESLTKWTKLLGPFRSIHFTADFTATYLPFSQIVSEVLERSCMSLKKLGIDVDERSSVQHHKIEKFSVSPSNSWKQNEEVIQQYLDDKEGRSYERMILWEMLGLPLVPYKMSLQEGHSWFHEAIQNDLQSSSPFNWLTPQCRRRHRTREPFVKKRDNHKNGLLHAEEDVSEQRKLLGRRQQIIDRRKNYESLIETHNEHAPQLPALREIAITLGPFPCCELRTMFDRILSQLAEVRLLQWCATLQRIHMPCVLSCTFKWNTVDWLHSQMKSPSDLNTATGKTAKLFETTFLDFMRALPSLRTFVFTSPLKFPRSLEWHFRCVESFAPMWRAVLLACGRTLEEIHVRASPAVAAALYKASTLEGYFLGVHPEIHCPELRVLSINPPLSYRFEFLDVEFFLQKVFMRASGVIITASNGVQQFHLSVATPYQNGIDSVVSDVGIADEDYHR